MTMVVNKCAACGLRYRERTDRVGNPGFCSWRCRTSPAATIARFRAKIHINKNGCWIWTAGRCSGGYGKFLNTTAHRFAYQKFVGAIPDGLCLDHICRNRACCNPAHLEPVTQKENTLRGDTFQARNAAKTHCPHGHEYTTENTYRYPNGRRRCKTCRRIADNKPAARARRAELKRQRRA